MIRAQVRERVGSATCNRNNLGAVVDHGGAGMVVVPIARRGDSIMKMKTLSVFCWYRVVVLFIYQIGS